MDGRSAGAVSSYAFTKIVVARTSEAHFGINTYPLTVIVCGSGSVGKSSDQATYTRGTSAQLMASPGTGWNLVGWFSGHTAP